MLRVSSETANVYLMPLVQLDVDPAPRGFVVLLQPVKKSTTANNVDTIIVLFMYAPFVYLSQRYRKRLDLSRHPANPILHRLFTT